MRLYPLMLRILARRGVPSGDAPDVAQTVILFLLPRWKDMPLTPDEHAGKRRRGFVGTVTMQFAFRYHAEARRREKHVTEIERAHYPDVAPSPEDVALDHEADAERARDVVLADLREATSPDFWRVFYAHEVECLPVALIARIEGIPVATVYNRLRLARRDLRAAITRARWRRSAEERRSMARKGNR